MASAYDRLSTFVVVAAHPSLTAPVVLQLVAADPREAVDLTREMIARQYRSDALLAAVVKIADVQSGLILNIARNVHFVDDLIAAERAGRGMVNHVAFI